MLKRTCWPLLFAVLAMLALMSACGADAGPSGPSIVGQATIGAAGGTVEGGGATLTIPAGALSANTAISIAQAPDMAPPEGYSAASPIFIFAPDGLVFQKPVEVAIVLDGDGTAATIVWSTTGASVEELPSTLASGSMTAHVTHFSFGFIGRADHRDGAMPDAPIDVSHVTDVTDAADGSPVDAPHDVRDATMDVAADAGCHTSGTGCDAGSQCCNGACSTGGICL